MLSILGYQTSVSDEKKFLHSNQKQVLDKELKIDLMPNLPEVPQTATSS